MDSGAVYASWTDKGIWEIPLSVLLLRLDSLLDKLLLQPFSVVIVIHPAGCCRNKPGGWALWSTRTSGMPLLALFSSKPWKGAPAWQLGWWILLWVSQRRVKWSSISVQLMSDLALTGLTVIHRAWHFWFNRKSDITQWGVIFENRCSLLQRRCEVNLYYPGFLRTHTHRELFLDLTIILQSLCLQKRSNLLRQETNKPWQSYCISVSQMRMKKIFSQRQ